MSPYESVVFRLELLFDPWRSVIIELVAGYTGYDQGLRESVMIRISPASIQGHEMFGLCGAQCGVVGESGDGSWIPFSSPSRPSLCDKA